MFGNNCATTVLHYEEEIQSRTVEVSFHAWSCAEGSSSESGGRPRISLALVVRVPRRLALLVIGLRSPACHTTKRLVGR